MCWLYVRLDKIMLDTDFLNLYDMIEDVLFGGKYMAMKKVKVEDAIGMVLGHDLTKIVPGEYKGAAFKKGHIIKAEDIVHLKSIGKDHIYLVELAAGQLHENQAAIRIAQTVAGDTVAISVPSEGRVNIKAKNAGILQVNREAITAINGVESMVFSTLHGGTIVQADTILAGVKVVPLVVEEALVERVERIASQYAEIITVKPMHNKRVGLIITGNEVYYGRIKDKYARVFTEKAIKYGATLGEVVYQPDDSRLIRDSILNYKCQGMDIVIAAGGMSVDPDDVTPDAIRLTGAKVITYGTPVLPGAMFMLAYLEGMAIFGMPACGMYDKATVFDIVFPQVLADITITRQDFAAMGYGGLCQKCDRCSYPHCPFGK